MNALKKVVATIVLTTVLQACIKKPAHSVRFNEFVHSGQGTYLLSNYQPIDTAEYFLLFSGDLSETDFDSDLMIVFDNDSKELQQTIPRSKMFQCNWSNLEKKYSSGTNNMALKVEIPVHFTDSNDQKSVNNIEQIRLVSNHSKNIKRVLLMELIKK